MIPLLPQRLRTLGVGNYATADADRCDEARPVAVSADWLRLARIARILSWLTLAWMGLEGGVAIVAAVLAGSVALLGSRLGSLATAGEGTQNLLCAYLAMAVFAGLAANTLLGVWWLDGVVALGIAGWAVVEGRRAWAGRSCGCASQPGAQC